MGWFRKRKKHKYHGESVDAPIDTAAFEKALALDTEDLRGQYGDLYNQAQGSLAGRGLGSSGFLSSSLNQLAAQEAKDVEGLRSRSASEREAYRQQIRQQRASEYANWKSQRGKKKRGVLGAVSAGLGFLSNALA